MPTSSRLLLDAIERSLRIDLIGADVSRIAAGHSTGWRTLPAFTTAHLLGLSILLERKGQAPVRLRPGEAFCMPAHVHHRSTVVAGDGLSRWSLFECRLFGSVPLLSLVAVPIVLRGPSARRLGDLNAAVAESLAPATDLRGILRKQARAFALVEFLLEVGTLTATAEALLVSAERLAPVLQHLEQHPDQPCSRAGLARLAGLSATRFHAVFRQAMGMPPLAYALSRRLDKAGHLLIASDLPVHEVASRLGFADPFYFSRIFTRRMRLTPTSYRRQARMGLSLPPLAAPG